MANKSIDKEIQDFETPWNGYKGKRIEDFIKKYLEKANSAFGYCAVSNDSSTGISTARFFNSVADFETWSGAGTDDSSELIKAKFSFNAPKEQETTYTMRALMVTKPNSTVVKGADCIFKLSYNCYFGSDVSQGDTEDASVTVTVNGTLVKKLTKAIHATGSETPNYYTINVGPYLLAATNKVVITVKNSHDQMRTFSYNIDTVQLDLSFSDNMDEAQTHEKAWGLRVNCYGADADVYCEVVDGSTTKRYIKSVSNGSAEFIIDPSGDYTDGLHKISIYAVNSEYGITTETLTTSYIKAGTLPAIAIGAGVPTKIKQYSTIKVPYFVYLPDETPGSTVEATGEVVYNDGGNTDKLITQTITVDTKHTSGKMLSFFVPLDNNNYYPKIKIRISIGSIVSVEQEVTITQAEVTLNPVDECKYYYTMRGRSNTDKDVDYIKSTYNNADTSHLVRSDNFKMDENNGFLDGLSMLIGAGKTVTIDGWKPFAQDIGANGTKQGLTIEMEFETGIATNDNAVIVDCMNNGTGFTIYANHIVFSCGGSSVDTYFPEQSRLKVSFVIDGATTHTVNNLGASTSETNVNLAYLYINGVVVRMFDYSTNIWKQTEPKNIVVGSADAQVKWYTFRAYEKALTYRDIVNNFAYDTPDVDEKIAIAKRNDILYNTGNVHNPDQIVSYKKVKEALPNTPICVWTIDNLPYDKNMDDVPIIATEFENPVWNMTDYGTSCAPFSVGAHMFNADGTSSNGYPLPYKNWAEIFTTTDGGAVNITLDPDNISKQGPITVTTYSITKGIPAENGETDMVHKVNFASSEGMFNIHAMNSFHNILLKAAKTDPTLYTKYQSQQVAENKPVVYRKSLSGFPEIGFRKTSSTGTGDPTFLSFYNFINNKYSPSMFGYSKNDWTKNQIWEVDENVGFFNQYLEPHKKVGDTIVESTLTKKPIFFCRVPKKSKSFTSETLGSITGSGQKLGKLKSDGSNLDQANKEIAVILRFNNWVYSCNPHIAERYKIRYGNYETLKEAVTYGSNTYTTDTPAYRKAKFLAEYKDYLVISDALFYYLYNEYIIGMDSMDKNMSIAFDDIIYNADGTVKQAHARFFERDTDSQSLYDNHGELSFKFWNEWNDCINKTTGEVGTIVGEQFNEDTQVFSPKHSIDGATNVFNGATSGLWDLIQDTMQDELANMYQVMVSSGLNYKDMYGLYKEFWSQLSENIYNADAMGYANTGEYTKAHGDKMKLLDYFLYFRSRYLDSKYHGATAVNNRLTLRMSSLGRGIALKHYIPIYASIEWGSANFATQRCIKTDEYAYMPFGFSATPSDATVYIDNCDMITELRTWYKTSNSTVLAGLEGLGQFIFNGYMNKLTRLKEFIMQYTAEKPNTIQTSSGFDLSGMKMVKKVIVTYVTGLNTPIVITSDSIEEVDFTGTPIQGVTIPPTESLTKLTLPETVRSLVLDGFPNLAADNLKLAGYANLDVINITNCKQLNPFDIVKEAYAQGAPLGTVTLHDLDVEIDNLDMLKYLANRKADLKGKITISSTVDVTYDDICLFSSVWGNVNDASNDLYVTYTQTAISSAKIVARKYLKTNGIYTPSLTLNPTNANNIKNIAWSLSTNKYASINKDTGEITVNSVGTEEEAPTAELSAVLTLFDGSTVNTNTKTVHFYSRKAKVGDIVFNDGSFEDDMDGIVGKTPIGVCFYINGDDARMVSLRQDPNSYPWGLQDNSLKVTSIDGSVCDIGLKHYALDTYTSFDINDKNILDSRQPDGFAVISNGIPASEWNKVKINLDIKNGKLDGVKENESIPQSRYNTYAIIERRNKILSDINVNLPIPEKTANKTELEVLKEYLINYSSVITYFYPVASMCYAYEPSVPSGQKLNKEFTAHHWWLWNGAEVVRCLWYASKGYTAGAKYNIFGLAYSLNIFDKIPTGQKWTSNENNSYTYISGGGAVSLVGNSFNADPWGSGKSRSYTYRACCSFDPSPKSY